MVFYFIFQVLSLSPETPNYPNLCPPHSHRLWRAEILPFHVSILTRGDLYSGSKFNPFVLIGCLLLHPPNNSPACSWWPYINGHSPTGSNMSVSICQVSKHIFIKEFISRKQAEQKQNWFQAEFRLASPEPILQTELGWNSSPDTEFYFKSGKM